jgi:hypothetical protein
MPDFIADTSEPVATEATAEPAPFDPRGLIDTAMIRAAESRLPELITLRQRAEAAIDTAESELRLAQVRHRDAILTGEDRAVTRAAVAEAAVHRDEAAGDRDAVEYAYAKAVADLPTVRAKAGEKLALYALETKLRLAREMDRLKAEIAALDAAAAQADQHLRACGIQFDPNLNIFQVREWRPASPPTPTSRRHSAGEMEALLLELASTGHDFVAALLPKE